MMKYPWIGVRVGGRGRGFRIAFVGAVCGLALVCGGGCGGRDDSNASPGEIEITRASAPEADPTAPDPHQRFRELVTELKGSVGFERHNRIMRELKALAALDPGFATQQFLDESREAESREGSYLTDNLLDVLASTRDPRIHPAVLVALRSDTGFVRVKAAQTLAGLPNPNAVDDLIANLARPDAVSTEHIAVLIALGAVKDPKGVSAVISFVARCGDLMCRYQAYSVLGNLGDRRAEDVLRVGMGSSDRAEKIQCAKALLKLGFADALETVFVALRAKHPQTVQLGLQVVQEVGLVEAIPDLKRLVADDRAQIRLYTVATLATLEIAEAFDLVRLRFDDEVKTVRRAALLSLAEKGDAQALDRLRLHSTSDGEDSAWSLAMLARLRDEASIVRMLDRLPKTSDAKEAASLIRGLSRTGDDRAISVLLDVVTTKDLSVAEERVLAEDAARYLANFRDRVTEPLILRFKDCRDPKVRLLLISSLNFLGSQKAIDTLVQLFPEIRDPAVSAAAKRQLKALRFAKG